MKTLCYLTAAFMVCALGVSAQADDKKAQELLVGKWEPVDKENNGKIIEFTKDGMLLSSQGKSSVKGTYRIIDETTIEVELPDKTDPSKLQKSKATFEVSKDELIITAAEGKKVTRFKRVK